MIMKDAIIIEIIGFEDSSCGPFACDEERTCELEECYPTEKLVPAYHALKSTLHERYGDRISVSLTLLDDGVPDYILKIIEKYHPPLPIVLINGKVTPLGRISLPYMQREIEKYL